MSRIEALARSRRRQEIAHVEQSPCSVTPAVGSTRPIAERTAHTASGTGTDLSQRSAISQGATPVPVARARVFNPAVRVRSNLHRSRVKRAHN